MIRLLDLSPASFPSGSRRVCPWRLLGRRQPHKFPRCKLLCAIFYLHILKQAEFLWRWEIFAAQQCPIAKGVTSRRRCGQRDCPALDAPHLQHSDPAAQGEGSASSLLVGEVTTSMQQRYFISKPCATLKAHRHLQPLLSPFCRQVLAFFIISSAITPTWLRDYPFSSCWNLSHRCSCPLMHKHTYAKGGSLKKPLFSDSGRCTYQTAPPCVQMNTTKCQPVAASSWSYISSLRFPS